MNGSTNKAALAIIDKADGVRGNLSLASLTLGLMAEADSSDETVSDALEAIVATLEEARAVICELEDAVRGSSEGIIQ